MTLGAARNELVARQTTVAKRRVARHEIESGGTFFVDADAALVQPRLAIRRRLAVRHQTTGGVLALTRQPRPRCSMHNTSHSFTSPHERTLMKSYHSRVEHGLQSHKQKHSSMLLNSNIYQLV